MAVVLREAELAHADDTELREDLQLLRTQVDECKRSSRRPSPRPARRATKARATFRSTPTSNACSRNGS